MTGVIMDHSHIISDLATLPTCGSITAIFIVKRSGFDKEKLQLPGTGKSSSLSFGAMEMQPFSGSTKKSEYDFQADSQPS